MVERERVKASLRAYALPERSDGEVEIERSEIVRGVATRKFFLGCLLLLAIGKPPQAVRPAGVIDVLFQFSAFGMITPRREISVSSFSVSSWYLDPLKLSSVEAISFPSPLK